MKKTHIGVLAAGIVIAIALFFAINPTQEAVVNELTGTWYGGGSNEETGDWWMQYTFEGNDYQLTTGTGYEEVGQYNIAKRYEDGSIDVYKIFDEGTKTHTMTIVTFEENNRIFLEGLQLDRIK